MLTYAEACARICGAITALPCESVPLHDAHTRVCSQTVTAPRDLPPFANSAMDGYAVRADDLQRATPSAPVTLPVTHIIQSGSTPLQMPLTPHTCMRIYTGAPIPAGADAVVMQEDTRIASPEHITFLSSPKHGQYVRAQGDDVQRGSVVIPTQTVLRAGELGILASLGYNTVSVYRRPRVAILSTGNELAEVEAHTPSLKPGHVIDSNRVMLAAWVQEAGGIPIAMPALPDDPEAIVRALQKAAAAADMIISSGGMSVGDYDVMRSVLHARFAVDFWKVAIKPGKPLAFGHVAGCPIIALPGNPVSAYVGFALFVRPALRKLAGLPEHALSGPWSTAQLTHAVRRDPMRQEWMRGRILPRDPEQQASPMGSPNIAPLPSCTACRVEPFAKQGSGYQHSLLGADVLIDVPAGEGEIAAESTVRTLIL